MKKENIFAILLLIGILLFGALIFMFAVPQNQFIGIEVGKTKIGATGDFSDSTIIILFSILMLAILIFLVKLIKLKSENKQR